MNTDAPNAKMSVATSDPASFNSIASGHRRRPVPGGGVEKISIRDLSFFYGPVQALKRINLSLNDHCVTALIGPSGCGKSTLIRVLNRIFDLYPDQRATGEVIIDGENILDPATDLTQLRARVGMTFQKANPFPLSIFENIAFGIRLHNHISRAVLRERVEAALRRAALWDEVKDILTHSALSLSGGQQQRLCIARAIALEPEILLFDEPCSALDPISTLKIEALLDDLRKNYCIVIVTHNMQQAARVSDYVAFMYLGEVIEFGTAEQIFIRPRNENTLAYVTGRFG
jgi:phosphate transport system ATP-binding protein